MIYALTQIPKNRFPIHPQSYQSSETCSNCHTRLYEQFEKSMHVRAFENPVFQYQFYEAFLPQMANDSDSVSATAACLACRSPTTLLSRDLCLPAPDAVDK
ncbi:MAG: multiheme c-type cytochrome [Candidatus Thiodiazotropha sp.]